MSARRVSRVAGVLMAVAVVGFVLGSSSGDDAEGSSSGNELSKPSGEDAVFTRGMELVQQGKYEDARERFEMALKKRKNDPDVLNMLAYTQRKTGHLEDAFENYRKALAARPKFPQAREYLAEAHLQAALLQVDVLRGYGPEGQKELDQVLAILRQAADSPTAETMDAATRSGKNDW